MQVIFLWRVLLGKRVGCNRAGGGGGSWEKQCDGSNFFND